MKEAIVKFNGGNLALLCSKCRVIIKTGKDFTQEELKFTKGEGYLSPQYCKKHETANNKQDKMQKM